MTGRRDSGSFRDPDGGVFSSEKSVVRTVNSTRSPLLDPEYSEFFKAAVEAELLVPFSPHDEGAAEPNPVAGCFELERIPVVTYPFEWSFRQIKEAALTSLDINLLALEHGLTLKDATAYNCQIRNGAMIFIDHGSFERTDGRLPWRPYGQFCRHFVAPLAIASTTGVNANLWLRSAIDGLDIWQTSRILPVRSYLKLSHLLHIHLHGRAIRKYERADPDVVLHQGTAGPGIWSTQRDLLAHLKRCVEKLRAPKTETVWTDYCDHKTYDSEQFQFKEDFVTSICAERNFKTVWDLGGNTGHFSRLVAEQCRTVVSMDSDHMTIDENWRINRERGTRNVVPIVYDIFNPSPGIGFANAERPDLASRSKPDAVLALALIHHIVVAGGIPMDLFAQYLHDQHAEIIIEFVGREDRQVRKLLSMRSDPCDGYSQARFETAFGGLFAIERKERTRGSERFLYHFTPREVG